MTKDIKKQLKVCHSVSLAKYQEPRTPCIWWVQGITSNSSPVTPCNTWLTENLSSEEQEQLSDRSTSAPRKQLPHAGQTSPWLAATWEERSFTTSKAKAATSIFLSGVQRVRQIWEQKNKRTGTKCMRWCVKKGGLNRWFSGLWAALPSIRNVWFSTVKLFVYFLL